MITIHDIAAFLDLFFDAGQIDGDPHGLFVLSLRPVQRIGLALEPWSGIGDAVQQHGLDALLLHRPWQLDRAALPAGVGVLAYHRAFDLHLTVGHNPRLANALGLQSVVPFDLHSRSATAMIGDCAPIDGNVFAQQLQQLFGGYEQMHAMPGQCCRIVVAGAMTDALVRAAAAQGAQLYLTGQFRQPAAHAVAETGIGVVAVGHARAEQWGLRALAGVLRERWAALDVQLLGGEHGAVGG